MVELFTSTGKGFYSTIKFNASTGEEYCESTGKYNSMVELFTSTAEILSQQSQRVNSTVQEYCESTGKYNNGRKIL